MVLLRLAWVLMIDIPVALRVSAWLSHPEVCFP
jgi:hypothetical protein